jgi:hypothetical protein
MHFRVLLMLLFVAATVAVDVVAIEQDWPLGTPGVIVEASLMLSQIGLLALWSVVAGGALLARLALLALGIGLWSLQWGARGDVPAVDMASLLFLSAAMVAVPIALFQRWWARTEKRRQFSLAALLGSLTGAALLLALAKQFSRPGDFHYVSEMFGIAAATSLTSIAGAIALLGPRLIAWRAVQVGLIAGVAGLLLRATSPDQPWMIWLLIWLHTAFIVTSLSVWRICGIRLTPGSSPSTLDPQPSTLG